MYYLAFHIVSAALKANAKAWTFEAKAIQICPRGARRPRSGRKDYVTVVHAALAH